MTCCRRPFLKTIYIFCLIWKNDTMEYLLVSCSLKPYVNNLLHFKYCTFFYPRPLHIAVVQKDIKMVSLYGMLIQRAGKSVDRFNKKNLVSILCYFNTLLVCQLYLLSTFFYNNMSYQNIGDHGSPQIPFFLILPWLLEKYSVFFNSELPFKIGCHPMLKSLIYLSI